MTHYQQARAPVTPDGFDESGRGPHRAFSHHTHHESLLALLWWRWMTTTTTDRKQSNAEPDWNRYVRSSSFGTRLEAKGSIFLSAACGTQWPSMRSRKVPIG
jgi:hypothetical protein